MRRTTVIAAVAAMLVAGLAGATEAADWNTIMGDINMDGRADIADFRVLRSNFGTSGLPRENHQSWTFGDLNGDGEVGPEDYWCLKQNFGATGGPVTVPATLVINRDMVLTVDRTTGAATLKNANPSVVHKVDTYQIVSTSGLLNPGTRAGYTPYGDTTPPSQGTWLGICDSGIMDPVAVRTTLGMYHVDSFGALMSADTALTSKSIAEGNFISAYATFKANGATVWSIGNPLLANAAATSDLTFLWTEINQPIGQVYAGRVEITPEPATVAFLTLGVLAVIRKQRK